jgi:nucleotide-binding universal stress UspA family protein
MEPHSSGAVVVGYDGTPTSRGALRFAIVEARRRAVPLHVVRALSVLPSGFLAVSPLAGRLADERRAAKLALRAEIAAQVEDLDVALVVRHGPAPEVLLDASGDGEALVVGRENRAGLDRLLGGATTEVVAAHAAAPVFVVPLGWTCDRRAHDRILVALKGPEHSAELLRAAFDRAVATGAGLCVVHGQEESWDGDGDRVPAAVEGLLAPWRRAYPAVPVTVEVTRGDPGVNLLESTRVADLAVVLRGVSPVLGPRLGHVLRRVLHAAACPVEIVPATDRVLPPLDLEIERAGELLR